MSNVRSQLRPPCLLAGPRAKLLVLAAVVELPLLAILYFTSGHVMPSALASGIQYYHLVPLSLLSMLWLFLFGHSAPAVGPLDFWYLLFFLGVYIGQVALTALLLWLALRRTSFFRGGHVPHIR
jgi:hypothetical protein